MKILYGRVIDAVSDEALEDGMVAVENERIVYVGKRGGYPVKEGEAEIYETENGTIMPGFIDAHAHLSGQESIHRSGQSPYELLLTSVRDLQDLVDAGITGVRDMSAFGNALKKAVEKGNITGPRIMPGGRVMSISSGHCDEPLFDKEEINRRDLVGCLVDGPEECYRMTRQQFREGAQFIKICATGGVSSAVDDYNDIEFSPEEIRVIVEEAERHNTYVTAHCTGTEGTKEAIRNGVRCIEHGVLLDEECARMMAEKKIPLVTTLSVSLGLADMKGLPEHMMKKAAKLGDASKHSFELAHRYGVMVALGTDYSNSPNTPFKEIGKEFYSLTRCGYSNMEAIKAGTINGAYLMKSEKKFGSLEAGKLADLVVVKGNPLEDIRLLGDADHIGLVMIGGSIKKDILSSNRCRGGLK